MENKLVWVGIDQGQKSSRVCVIDERGVTLHERECESSAPAIFEALRDYSPEAVATVAVEAGASPALARGLIRLGYPVKLYEARKAQKFLSIRVNKSDASDARGIADLGRLGAHTVSEVHLKSVECEHLRSQLRLRHQLVRLRIQIEGMIRSRLIACGFAWSTSRAKGALRALVDRSCKEFLASEGIDIEPELAPLVQVAESLREYSKKLDKDFQRLSQENSVCKLLMEVPGVGPVTAISFYSAIEDPSRFSRASDAAAYLGLIPKRYQSGNTSQTRGITKVGSKLTRCHLVTAASALRVSKPECSLFDWTKQLRERVGPHRSRIALARKLAVVLLAMWRNGTHFQPYPRQRLTHEP
jgi:transposase